MTPQDIKDAIGIDGLDVRRSENGNYWFVARQLTLWGQSYSHSIRIADNPSPAQLEMVKAALEDWEEELTNTKYNFSNELPN
jgi:hypothetical protein